MNSAAFMVIAVLTLAAALAAATLTKLVHAALSFAAAFVGVAGFYFFLGAEFVGLIQVFVYVGAVAVLIVFTILLTRHDLEKDRGFHWSGGLIALGRVPRGLDAASAPLLRHLMLFFIPAVAGVTLQALSHCDALWTASTDARGIYRFTRAQLACPVTAIALKEPMFAEHTTPNPVPVALPPPGAIVTADFGVVPARATP